MEDMVANCGKKTLEWELFVCNVVELLELVDTTKVLNEDDALELVMLAVPAASAFVQVLVNPMVVRTSAWTMIRTVHSSKLDFIALAFRARRSARFGFGEMVATLLAEQLVDDLIFECAPSSSTWLMTKRRVSSAPLPIWRQPSR